MAHPFLKWAGGKRAIVPAILERLPKRIKHYIEPFLGGGAVFFALRLSGRLRGEVVLADRNPDLMNAWQMVQREPEALADAIEVWAASKTTFYEVRGLDVATLSPLVRAARLMYLNRTCFNGLYRLNRSGRFNVPFGDARAVRLVDRDNLRACSRALEGVELMVGDFAEVMAPAKRGSVVYCDPPYWPIKASSFTYYDGCPFLEPDQVRLGQAFRQVFAQGAKGLLSNTDLPETRALYAGLKLETIGVPRRINSVGTGRGEVSELLVGGPVRSRGKSARASETAASPVAR